MKSIEPVLQAVRTEVQFEMAGLSAALMQAAALREMAQRDLLTMHRHAEAAALALTGAMERSQINPPLLRALRVVYHAEQDALRSCRARLSSARQSEQRLQTELMALRNRDQSLERALRWERLRARQREQIQEMIDADDLWLQRVRSEQS